MRYIFFFLILSILPLSRLKAQTKLLQQEGVRFTYTVIVDSTKDKGYVQISEVVIREKMTGKIFQILLIPENMHSSVNEEEFVIEDMNFDGVEDLRVLEYRPAYPNQPFYYYLYDGVQQKYVLQKGEPWIELSSPQFDAQNKHIHSHMHDGTMGYGHDVYKFIDNKWVIIEHSGFLVSYYYEPISDDEDAECEHVGYLRTNQRYELIKGKMTLIEERKEYEFNGEKRERIDSLFQLINGELQFVK